MIKPFQERIYDAIEDISVAENYAVVFDKANTATLIYANPKYDISEQVLDKLGYTYKPQQTTKGKK